MPLSVWLRAWASSGRPLCSRIRVPGSAAFLGPPRVAPRDSVQFDGASAVGCCIVNCDTWMDAGLRRRARPQTLPPVYETMRLKTAG